MLSCLQFEGDMEALGDPREPYSAVRSEAIATACGDCREVRDRGCQSALGAVVWIQLLDGQRRERAKPCEPRGARGEQPHRTRSKLFAPLLRVELLFCPNGVFKEAVDVGGREAELGAWMYLDESRHAKRLIACGQLRSAWVARADTGGRSCVGMCPARRGTRVSGPWSRDDWRHGRERSVYPARACAD